MVAIFCGCALQGNPTQHATSGEADAQNTDSSPVDAVTEELDASLADGQLPDAAPIDADPCTPLVLASDQPNPTDIAVDDHDVYWLTSGDNLGPPHSYGDVVSEGKKGGPLMTLSRSGENVQITFISNDQDILLIAGPYLNLWNTNIELVPKDGSPGRGLGLAAMGSSVSAADDSYVYFMRIDPDVGTPTIFSASLADGTQTEIAVGSPDGMALDSNIFYWTDGHVLHEVPTSGGAISVQLPWSVSIVVADDDDLFLALDGGGIGKVSKKSGASTLLASSTYPMVVDVVLDNDFVYFVSNDGTASTTQMVSKSGVQSTILPISADHVAVDTDFLYWTEPSTGRIMRTTKACLQPQSPSY